MKLGRQCESTSKVGAFNKEKGLVGAFFVIDVKLRDGSFPVLMARYIAAKHRAAAGLCRNNPHISSACRCRRLRALVQPDRGEHLRGRRRRLHVCRGQCG